MSAMPPIGSPGSTTLLPPVAERKTHARVRSLYNPGQAGITGSPSGISSGEGPRAPEPANIRRFCGALDCFLPKCLVDLLESFCCWIASFCITPPKSAREELDSAIERQIAWMMRQDATQQLTVIISINLNKTRQQEIAFAYDIQNSTNFKTDVQRFIRYNLGKLEGALIQNCSLEFVSLITAMDGFISGYVHTHSYDISLDESVSTQTRTLNENELGIKRTEALDGLNRAQIVNIFRSQDELWNKKNASNTDLNCEVKILVQLYSQEARDDGIFLNEYSYTFSKRSNFSADMKTLVSRIDASGSAPFARFSIEIVKLYRTADLKVTGHGYQYAFNQPPVQASFASLGQFPQNNFQLKLKESDFQYDRAMNLSR